MTPRGFGTLQTAMRELESAPSLLASRVAVSTFSAPIPTTRGSLKGQVVQKVTEGGGGLAEADGKSSACDGGHLALPGSREDQSGEA